MPAEIVVMADCASNYGIYLVPGSRELPYVVTFSGSEGPAHCECESWKFHKEPKTCKHVERVWNGACMYNPQWHDGKADPEFMPDDYTYKQFVSKPCPACGGPMVAVRRAV